MCQQEINNRNRQQEDLQNKLDSTQKKFERLDAKYTQMEKDKTQIIRVPIKNY